MENNNLYKEGFYSKYIKRILDLIISVISLIILSPVLVITAILVRIKLGSPIIFSQKRPGKNDNIFTLYKFRTMTDEKDEKGNLKSDGERLTNFGKMLRNTSLDELPEIINIIKGDMSFVGPRPQLVKDMIFMSREQRKRHLVRQGLTGLAQVNGRNNVTWEEKFEYDLKYIEKITFFGDLKIVLKTIKKVFKSEDINTEGMDTAQDFGDYLLQSGKISEKKYKETLELLEYDENDFMYYNHSFIKATPPHEDVNILPVLDNSIWNRNKSSFFTRWTENFDYKEPTEWWYCIKDDKMDLKILTSKQRYEINKGLKNLVVNIENPSETEEETYKIAVMSYEEYPDEYRNEYTEEEHHKNISEWEKDSILFVARSKENSEIYGYAVCKIFDEYAELSISKVPHKYQKSGTNAALVYAVCEEVLNKRELKYVCDGARNIKHKTNYQDYLIKYFGFRRAYCVLKIKYKPAFKLCINILYPFRKVIKNTKNKMLYNVYCILFQEEIRRSFK